MPALGGTRGTLAIVGMAAFFAAVVRAPLTATTTLLVPMLASCFAAVLVCTALRGQPIYDTLRLRLENGGQGPVSAVRRARAG